ncbi:hypothetical protein DITRI_Ditri04bG0149900 [Diplodiscus trichospermus]
MKLQPGRVIHLEKPADPFDLGSGLVNPNRAAKPGLVYGMDIDDYIALTMCLHDNPLPAQVPSHLFWM